MMPRLSGIATSIYGSSAVTRLCTPRTSSLTVVKNGIFDSRASISG
jgi:hypothetical protein